MTLEEKIKLAHDGNLYMLKEVLRNYGYLIIEYSRLFADMYPSVMIAKRTVKLYIIMFVNQYDGKQGDLISVKLRNYISKRMRLERMMYSIAVSYDMNLRFLSW
jgi:hypothetical protein